jgi:phosphoserine phosphatase
MIKAVLFDFDGTLVTEDLLVVVSEIVGKEKESFQIDQEFWTGKRPGLSGLIERINLLQGVSYSQIKSKLDENNYLMPGARELVEYLRINQIKTIVGSGNIVPILKYYQELLGFDYIIGSKPKMDKDTIIGITQDDYPHSDFKLSESVKILQQLGIKPEETLAIGDSPGDKSRFVFSGVSIAINPKEGIDKFATYVIKNDLRKVIDIIEKINK